MECKNIEWVKWAIDCIKEEDDDAAKVQILLVRMFVKCFIFRGIFLGWLRYHVNFGYWYMGIPCWPLGVPSPLDTFK